MRRIDSNSLAGEPLSHDADVAKQVILHSGSVPHLTQLARTRIPPDTSLTPHAHNDMYEIFLVIGGQGRVHCGGHAYDLAPGICIEISPGEVHAFENAGNEELVLVYFGIAE